LSTSTKAYSAKEKKPEKQRECTWCKKQGHKYYIGHVHTDCRKLKAHKANPSQSKRDEKDKEQAKIATVSDTNSDQLTSSEYPTEKAFVPQTSYTSSMPEWILDSGASTHMTAHKELFTKLSSYGGTVTIGDNSILSVEGRGTIEMECLYAILDSSSQYAVQQIRNKASFSFYLEAYNAFCHPGSTVMENLLKKYPSTIPSKPETFHCPSCILSKSTHTVPHFTHKRASKPFDIVHSDLSGKFSTKSLGGNEYYIVFIDDFSRFSWVYFLKKKSDAVNAIKNFTNLIQTQFNTTIKSFRTDNGGEYINSEVESYLADNGIILQNSPPYEHESNGLAERFNRTIVTKARTMLMDHPKFLWAEAIACATYLYNRLPHRGIDNRFPIEVLNNTTPPPVHHLHPFGSKAYVHIPDEARPSGSKLQPRTMEGIFVGYTPSSKIYRIYIPDKRTIKNTSQVIFPNVKKQLAVTLPLSTPSDSKNVKFESSLLLRILSSSFCHSFFSYNYPF
jgi:transposase InsO family protein